MALFTVDQVLEIVGARVLEPVESSRLREQVLRVTTDSRDVLPGDLFVALSGERYDGHAFLHAALQQGAIGAVVARRPRMEPLQQSPLLLLVADTLIAFQQLAAHHRSRFDIPIVAVTGSNGKTTTKDMVAVVLAERGSVLKTEGNLNNRIGVPKTLLRLAADHEAAVIEMGVDHAGQTTRLCEIANPTIGVITNIGPDHLEFFGSLEGSAQAKAEMLDLMPPDGAVVLNADDANFEYLAARARCKVVSFGLGSSAQVTAENVSTDAQTGTTFQLVLPGRSRHTSVAVPVHGLHNVSNALAASAVGYVMGMSGAAIARGLARFRPASMRSEVGTIGGVTVINDCYNANPASMKAAIDLLTQLGSGRRTIAVLGDMLELGRDARKFHREVGLYLGRSHVTDLVAVGDLGHSLAEGARSAGLSAEHIREVADAAAAASALQSFLGKSDVVLIKGSRGIRLEHVVEQLRKMFA